MVSFLLKAFPAISVAVIVTLLSPSARPLTLDNLLRRKTTSIGLPQAIVL
jgi:hypothetical protein